ncbi:MAG: adenylate/guanylate cyclase domain-containing protein [Leptospiraceae bacterium]|nr:adenylate/guanylate cyclase domain-containing protein [Leptospiraceae bacterium]
MIKIIEKLIGNPKFTSLEFRLFNSITLVNGILNILGAFFTFHLPNFIFVFSITMGSGVLFLLFYYLSRFYNLHEKLFWPFTICLIIFLSFNWITNSGSTGGAHYYFIPALTISTILMRNRKILLVYSLYLIVILSLFYIEYFHKDMITYYPDIQERYLDVIPNYSFIFILNGILILILVKNLNVEKKKSESLLLNILPQMIADELKQYDSVKPSKYNSASVMFSDMAGFTKIAEMMSPEELVEELHFIFSAFDEIVCRHGIEKIKTIGDAYMAVSGVPHFSKTHAIDICLCALEMVEFMKNLRERKVKENKPFWEFRLGIHSGEVVAGVVGKEKFAYDLWGDTVNTASRLESSGVKGRVNISIDTYNLVKDYFICESRGKIPAKNKGEIEMFLLIGLKDEYLGETSIKPNEKYFQLVGK